MKLLDLKSFSKQTSLSVFTLRKYIKDFGMPCYQVGKKYLVNPDECEVWFEKHKNTSKQQAKSMDELLEKALQDAGVS